jgi:hypothetical protein
MVDRGGYRLSGLAAEAVTRPCMAHWLLTATLRDFMRAWMSTGSLRLSGPRPLLPLS